MEIKFNPDLDYQNDAISSVVDIFRGQERTYSNFTIYDPAKISKQMGMYDGTEQNEIGVANQLTLHIDEICENLKDVQRRNTLKVTNEIKSKTLNLAIDMETGERVIIVMGAINALESGVSGTLVKYNP